MIPITNTEHILCHPLLLPPTADPQGSTRFNATILWEQYPIEPHENNRVEFYDDLDNGKFLVREYNQEFEQYYLEIGVGIVLRELNQQYSWWFNLHNNRYCFTEGCDEDD